MTKGHEPDEWLMGQVALGKREYLAPLVRRYASGLLTYIERMTGDRHVSEELFQEVFLAVWVKRRQYRFPKAFRSWLFAIATNRCRAAFRKGRVTVLTQGESSHEVAVAARSNNPGPLEAAIDTETATLVASAVAQLPPQQRSVVVLRVWNGLSYADIAESLGSRESTVRSNMHHALVRMRRFLEPRM
jgi:RNA polymerase sigma-70 factor (ECF subfamily)